MALMNRALNQNGIDPDGELPDHLTPILLYLDQASQPLPELLEVLEPSVHKMRQVLHKKDPANPYISLFDAILHLPRLEKKPEGV
jgi:nitrate reductase delta subunit